MRLGPRLEAHQPPDPCSCPHAIFPTLLHAPPGVIPASQSLPEGGKLSAVHVVSRLYIHTKVVKILRTGAASEPYSAPAMLSGLRSPTLGQANTPVNACVILGSSRNFFIGLQWMLGISLCKAHHRSIRWGPSPTPRGSQGRNPPRNLFRPRLEKAPSLLPVRTAGLLVTLRFFLQLPGLSGQL